MAIRKRKQEKRGPWNKGVEVGPRDPFSLSNVVRIRKKLAKQRGDAGIRNLAMFSTAIDTMLRGCDLLSLTVKDVRKRNGVMRDTVEATTVDGHVVRCTLSEGTRSVLESWIRSSAKKPRDYLFTALYGGHAKPLTTRQLSRLVKTWVVGVGLDPAAYGTESLRRTRARHILKETGNLEVVRVLLGHSKVESTARYLRDVTHPNPLAVSRAHEI